MTSIKCNNSERKSIVFFANGGNENDIIVHAMQDGEYWFFVGNYSSLKSAKRSASKKMAKYGFCGVKIPKEYGGAGGDYLSYAIFIQICFFWFAIVGNISYTF